MALHGSSQETRAFDVAGMTCQHCERAIVDELSALEAVEAVTANASAGRVTVTLDAAAAVAAQVNDDTLIAAIDEAGYRATRRREPTGPHD